MDEHSKSNMLPQLFSKLESIRSGHTKFFYGLGGPRLASERS